MVCFLYVFWASHTFAVIVSLWVKPYHKDHESGYFGVLSLRDVFATSAHSWPYSHASLHRPCSNTWFYHQEYCESFWCNHFCLKWCILLHITASGYIFLLTFRSLSDVSYSDKCWTREAFKYVKRTLPLFCEVIKFSSTNRLFIQLPLYLLYGIQFLCNFLLCICICSFKWRCV